MWDGIIIGGGLAGLIAGNKALDEGKRAIIISEGAGSLTSAAGVFDFGDIARLQRKAKHPYTLFEETTIRRAFEYFLKLCPQYRGEWGGTGPVITPLGTLRQAQIMPRRFQADQLEGVRRILLLAPEGLKDFFPEVVKSSLETGFPEAEVIIKPVAVERFKPWYELGKSILANQYARFWDSAEGLAELQKLFREIGAETGGLKTKNPGRQGRGESVLLFPGLAAEFCPALEQVLLQAPFPVLELTAFPPSVAGLYLYEELKRRFQSLGGELLTGSRVVRAETEGKEIKRVILDSKGKEAAYSARRYVIASGGVLGGGIAASPQGIRETIAGLPLFIPPSLTKEEFLGEQPYAAMGVEADSELRPLDPARGEVLLTNVMVVGRTLAHWDPWRDSCGGGVSITSGFVAGTKLR